MWLRGLLLLCLAYSNALASDEDSRKKIVVIDTGITFKRITSKAACIDGAKSTVGDSAIHFEKEENLSSYDLHGSNIFGLIEDQIDIKTHCIYSIRAFKQGLKTEGPILPEYLNALKIANQLNNVVGLNLSLASGFNPGAYSYEEYDLLRIMISRGIKIFVAMGNGSHILDAANCHVYPVCLKLKPGTEGIIAVASVDRLGKKLHSSNWTHSFYFKRELGLYVGTPRMSGTSQATAIATGKYFGRHNE